VRAVVVDVATVRGVVVDVTTGREGADVGEVLRGAGIGRTTVGLFRTLGLTRTAGLFAGRCGPGHVRGGAWVVRGAGCRRGAGRVVPGDGTSLGRAWMWRG
jgi:hypothetical protein